MTGLAEHNRQSAQVMWSASASAGSHKRLSQEIGPKNNPHRLEWLSKRKHGVVFETQLNLFSTFDLD
jgi:hypothetical protein